MAKSLRSMEKMVDSMLGKPLLGLGFEGALPLIFQRELPDVRQFLRFPARLENNFVLFDANAAIRIEKIEELLGNTDPLYPTLVMPIHLLRPNKEYFEWRFPPESSQDLIDQVLADCSHFLLPFMEKMSVMTTLKSQLIYEIDYFEKAAERLASLNSEAERKEFRLAAQITADPKLVLIPEQRIEKLAAIHVLEGRSDAAEDLVNAEIGKLLILKQIPPRIAMRLRLEGLKKVLIS